MLFLSLLLENSQQKRNNSQLYTTAFENCNYFTSFVMTYSQVVELVAHFLFCSNNISMLQRTLVVLKPDTVGRSIVGEIISRFERVGLHLTGMKMLTPDRDFLFHHYETLGKMISRRGQKPFDVTVEMMMTGPVVAMVWEGVEAVEVVRKMVGTTEPKVAAP
jgi:nucleoside diphosphate kinase